jgi:hypothetical protein
MNQKILNRMVIVALIISFASLIFQFGRSVGSNETAKLVYNICQMRR